MAPSTDSFFTPGPVKALETGGLVVPFSTWPGITPASTSALKAALQKDYEKWHVLFDASHGFHNHLGHQVICVWAMGGTPEAIDKLVELSLPHQLVVEHAPEQITVENFNAHVGDTTFYQAYREFFAAEVELHGAVESIEKWIFTPAVNLDQNGKGNPHMLARLMSLILHPFIRLGYGLEFDIPAMIVQGLAETAVHRSDMVGLLPDSFFSSSGIIEGLSSKLQKNLSMSKPSNVHVFSIVSKMLKDEVFINSKPISYEALMAPDWASRSPVLKYIEDWTFDASDLDVVQEKIKELQWTATLLYVAGKKGMKPGDPFFADFISVHLVTSALFLPVWVSKLSPRSRYLLLSMYLSSILALWYSRGCPVPNIKSFYEYKVPETSWAKMFDQATGHADEHLAKTIRALAQFSQLYGHTPANIKEFSGQGIPDTELLDGTFFYRTAALTSQRVSEGVEDESYGFAPGSHWFWDRF